MKFKNIVIVTIFIASHFNAFSQKTLYGVVKNSVEQTMSSVVVSAVNSSDSTITNTKGEYTIIVSDSCKELLFTINKLKYLEKINNRTIINVKLPIQEKSKNLLSYNPKKDYPWGLQLTVAGLSFFNIGVNYFRTPNHSFELGFCARGISYGTRWYFDLNDYGNNRSLYVGAISNISIDRGIKLYFPFGYHVISHNGMTFSIEVAGAYSFNDDVIFTNITRYIGFGINFGFQF